MTINGKVNTFSGPRFIIYHELKRQDWSIFFNQLWPWGRRHNKKVQKCRGFVLKEGGGHFRNLIFSDLEFGSF